MSCKIMTIGLDFQGQIGLQTSRIFVSNVKN